MALFAMAYARACRGHDLDYQSTGSAKGRSEFISGRTDFAATDFPLGADPGESERARSRCGGHEAWNLPVVFGAIAVIYNLAAVDSLVLDAATIAKIFAGTIKTWDAPEVAGLNPTQSLPAEPIVVISRIDESGTTDNFQKYLQAAGGVAWGRGAGETFNGSTGMGAKGNEGAWAAMRSAAGSITYIAWPFAKQNGLKTARILTAAGSDPVALSDDSVTRSIAGLDFKTGGNDLILDTSSVYTPTQVGSYPIVMGSYEVVCSVYPDPAMSLAVKKFLATAASGDTQADLAQSGYVPVPESVRERLDTAINAIS